MNRKFFYIIITLLFVWSLWSLQYSPVVWLDEAQIASFTHSFIEGNGIALELDEGQPMLVYGPIYFLIEAAFIKVLGFGFFTFRLVNFIFGILSVLILGKVLQKFRIEEKPLYFLLLLFATDVTFITNSHSGRMELVAIFFALLAYWTYLRSDEILWKNTIQITTFLTLAFMTTPRSVVILMPVAVMFLFKLSKSKEFGKLIVYIVIPLILYSVWILYAFGSFSTLIDCYFHANETSQNLSYADRFISFGRIHITKWHYPIVATGLIVVIHSIYCHYFQKVAIFFASIVLFYFLVYDMGGYDIYIIPMYIIIIAIGIKEVSVSDIKCERISIKVLLFVCLFINIGCLGVKMLNIQMSKELRDHTKMNEWVCANIPEGSRVAGSYPYYYSVINHGCEYRRLERDNIEPEITFSRLKDLYHPEYIIVNLLQFTDDEKSCFEMFKTTLVSSYHPQAPESKINQIFDLIGMNLHNSYAGEIYKVEY